MKKKKSKGSLSNPLKKKKRKKTQPNLKYSIVLAMNLVND